MDRTKAKGGVDYEEEITENQKRHSKRNRHGEIGFCKIRKLSSFI